MNDDFFKRHYAQQAQSAKDEEEANYPEFVHHHNKCVDEIPNVIRYILDSYRECPPKKHREVEFEGVTYIGWPFLQCYYDGDHNWLVTLLSSGALVQHDDYALVTNRTYDQFRFSRLTLQDGRDIPHSYEWLDKKFKALLSNPPVENADAFRDRFGKYAPSFREETPSQKSSPRPPQPPSPHQVTCSNQRQQAEAFALRNEHAIRDAYSNNRRRCRIPINVAMLNRRYPGITEGEPLVDALCRALQARIGYTFAIDRARTNDRYLWITFPDEDATKREERARNDARVRRYLDSGTNRQPTAPPQEQKRRTLGQVISDFLR